MSEFSVAADHKTQQRRWPLLLTAPAIALRLRVCMLATVGVLAVWSGDTLVGITTSQPPANSLPLGPVVNQAVSTLAAVGSALVQPFVQVFQGEAFALNLVRCLWRIAVWGVVGGAIARTAALSYTRDESPDVTGAVRFALRNKSGFIGAPLLLLAGLAAASMPILAAKFAMQVSWLAPLTAALWPAVMVAAVVATLYAVAAVIAWPLMWAAAATDNSDAFDAVSRMFAYAYQKPLRLCGDLLLVMAVGLCAAVAAQGFATAAFGVCTFAAGETASPWALSTAAWWQSVAAGLVNVYLTAYLWTAAGAVYLLRRQDVDGVHADEVFIDPNEFSGGLPELAATSSGVPVVHTETSQAA